jgi:predicted nucleotidyltransferase
MQSWRRLLFMTAGERIPDFDDRLRRLAQRLAADRTVAATYLYGSRARGDARPSSDVDLAVVLTSKMSPSERWQRRLALLEAAAAELGSDAVDLVILEEVPAPLAHRVVRDGRLIVDTDPRRRVEVVEDVFRRYLDEAPLRRALDEGMRARLAEGRFAR